MHLEELLHGGSENAEVEEPRLPVEPDQQEPARPGHEDAREHHGRRRRGAELQVEDHEDHEERQRDDQGEPAGGAEEPGP